MEAALINLHAEVHVCFGASNLCCFIVLSVVDSRVDTSISTLHEACRENVMSLRGGTYRNANCNMAVVHGKLLYLRGSVDAVCERT